MMPSTAMKLSQLRRMAQRLGDAGKVAEPAERIFLLAGDGIHLWHGVSDVVPFLAQVGLPGGDAD